MNTIHHGFWTYFIFRKKRQLVKWFVIGSIAPDIIYFVMFLYLGVQKEILTLSLLLDLFKMPMFGFPSDSSNMALTQLHDFILEMFQHPIVEILRFTGHSLLVWTILSGLVYWRMGFKLSPLKAFLLGWLGHILTDLLTHATDATPILYPLSDLIVRSPISYWNPDYYGKEFNIVNNILLVLATVYLIIRFLQRVTNRGK
ncbi:metal-dependent hydrolase [Halobacillus shinanisalinarum]|uniref:Metal-dependent hydrolase n=1 Tax=Halobacillus shinanisalinarum TaxID=2932258 RepID=A0ABY4H1E3_9BACI|nr:zinc dependent phospholipase C family protein [Halobacillus shinanisalinarum]UOQ93990.1 metal-dependent hydrolase [Halobacillus shinanisalinarum]